MINTVNSKQQQLTNGFFKTGSGSEVMLIIGSCRSVPYANYFDQWNQQNNNKFTITYIDPYNWCYNLNDERIDLEEKINYLENNTSILDLFKSVKYFVHEFYSHFGMFNCDKKASKNVYQFGLNPVIDICIPAWNDIFTLCGDIVSFDMGIRKKAIADYNVTGKLSEGTKSEILLVSLKNMNKFYEVCRLSDIPEMENYFKDNFRKKRFHFNFNHVSKHFTMFVFSKVCDKLSIMINGKFLEQIGSYDMFDNNHTKLTDIDLLFHNYEWNESAIQLKDKLF